MNTPEEQNIFKEFESAARKVPHKSAVIYMGTIYTYARLLDLVERFGDSLHHIGIRKNDIIILYIPNSIQWVVAWLGALREGAVTVPITPIYTSFDLEYIAKDTGAKGVICADRNFGYVKQVKENTGLEHVIVSNVADLLPWYKRVFGWAFDKIPRGKVVWEENTHPFRSMVRRDGGKREPASIDRDHLAEILFTGGTTKHPKGVPITHSMYLTGTMEQLSVCEGLFKKEDNVIMCGAPLFHVLGQTCGLGTLCTGGTLIVCPKVNLDGILDYIRRFKAKTLIGVPALYRMILEHDRVDQYDLSSLEYCFSAGDVLPVEVGNRWRKRFDRQVYQGYGATETVGGVAMCPTGVENPPRSMGMVVSSKKVKIVDPLSLKPVKTGEAGELLVSSDNMVTYYWNKAEETATSFVNIEGRTWYRTADVVTMDREGHLYFVDRTVDTIKYKGYRVSASEIESVLQEHPAVISSCVVGVADDKVGERIKAFVVLKKGIKGITGYDLIKWCRQKLIAYKVPQYIEFRDMLPKSKVGKLLRREIRDEERKRQVV